MPFKSKAQRAYLYANEPKVAAEFQAHTPKGAKLPAKVSHGYGQERRQQSSGGKKKR